ncbi:MAG: CDP-2,3-bis-(O-geranylgeranyl)-sn-glycerol synthase [Candidatus Micrarchaeia archaeon]
MPGYLDTFLMLLLYILPAYFANAAPVLLGSGTPIDLKRKLWDGKRAFGDGKTIRGFVSGVLAGTFIGGLCGIFLPTSAYYLYPVPYFYYVAGLVLSFGTMLGDLLGSFFKRRLGMKRGHPSFLLDQLFFLVFALLFAYPLSPAFVFEPVNLVFLFAFTYVIHVASNYIANRLGLKKVPW